MVLVNVIGRLDDEFRKSTETAPWKAKIKIPESMSPPGSGALSEPMTLTLMYWDSSSVAVEMERQRSFGKRFIGGSDVIVSGKLIENQFKPHNGRTTIKDYAIMVSSIEFNPYGLREQPAEVNEFVDSLSDDDFSFF